MPSPPIVDERGNRAPRRGVETVVRRRRLTLVVCVVLIGSTSCGSRGAPRAAPSPTGAPTTATGAPTASTRRVNVRELDSGPTAIVEVRWMEPDIGSVWLPAVGLGWDAVAAVITGLGPVDPSAMPVLVPPPPVPRCVDAHAQLAPTLLPPGWKRFVLMAQPSGSCGQYPFVMMSIVTPETLVTIVTTPADDMVLQSGQAVTVGSGTGRFEPGSWEPGVGGRLTIIVDTVLVDVHGNADVDMLRAVAESVRAQTDDEWADLVAAVGQDPG